MEAPTVNDNVLRRVMYRTLWTVGTCRSHMQCIDNVWSGINIVQRIIICTNEDASPLRPTHDPFFGTRWHSIDFLSWSLQFLTPSKCEVWSCLERRSWDRLCLRSTHFPSDVEIDISWKCELYCSTCVLCFNKRRNKANLLDFYWFYYSYHHSSMMEYAW